MPSRVCRIPIDWTMLDYARHSCFDGSHIHLSHAQVAEHEKRDLVIWLYCGISRHAKSVVQIEELAERDVSFAGPPSISHPAGRPINIGLSFRVGPYLARRVRERERWALVMLSHINMRPEREVAI
jgi:hypothetical protein